MTDKERGNVIDWLTEITENPEQWAIFYSESEQKLLAQDTLALLKEQEPVKPILTPWITDDDGEPIVSKKECGKCGWQFFTEKPKYCEECGTPIDWTTS